MNIHILVLIIAIALFGVLAFKQMSALILAPLVTIFVILCSGLPVLESLKGLFCGLFFECELSGGSAHSAAGISPGSAAGSAPPGRPPRFPRACGSAARRRRSC